MSKRNINEIIARNLFGKPLSEEEEGLLDIYIKDEDFKKKYESLLEENGAEIVRRYREYRLVPEVYPVLRKRHAASIASLLRSAAAVFLVLVIAGAMYWYAQYTKVTPPVIDASVQMAMQQSRESGKQEADIVNISEVLKAERDELTAKSNGIRVNSGESRGKEKKAFSVAQSLSKEQLLKARRITTHHDKEFWVTLDDGTLVHLNYNTRLIYPEQFGRDNRNVILDGEAYFMVAKDRSRPFIVHTPQGDVMVYGTEFNVNTRADDSVEGQTATSIVLVKGAVSVTPHGGKEQIMKPGQQCHLSHNTCRIEYVDVAPYVAWNEGIFYFDNCTLEYLMKILSHWYAMDIRFDSDETRSIMFTGNINKYSSITPAIQAIRQVTGLHIETKDNTIIINNHYKP